MRSANLRLAVEENIHKGNDALAQAGLSLRRVRPRTRLPGLYIFRANTLDFLW